MNNIIRDIFNNGVFAAALPYVKEFLRLITWVPIVVLLVRWVRLLYAPKTVEKPFAILSVKEGNTRFEINAFETSVGRMKNSDIVLNFPFISRNHAVICYRKNKWYVFDTASSGGVTVNGRRIKKGKEIVTGDTVGFAQLEFIFAASPDKDDSRDIYSSVTKAKNK
ncbi:MAG: FHA domain-containing protein [Oscillospiraceae bacterium]|nr:FHA domain-containing protein [Candidatus Equicaccousia limihippi]